MRLRKDNIRAVILVDGVDLGRCPLGSRVPRALWPVGDKTVLENLIEQLAGQGIRRVAVCQTDGRGVVEKWRSGGEEEGGSGEDIVIQYIAEEMPRGAGGCLFDAAQDGDELLLVLNCNIISVPDIAEILDSHTAAQADMTVGYSPNRGGDSLAVDASPVFLCERSVLEHIPDVGYCDIKEGLIPQLVAVGKKIHALPLSADIGAFRSWREYLGAMLRFVDTKRSSSGVVEKGSRGIAVTAKVDAGVRIFGPVVVCDGAEIMEDAIVFGPAIIGPDVHVGRGAVVAESVIWEGSRVGAGCVVQGSLLDCGVRVANNKTIEGELVAGKYSILGRAIDKVSMWARDEIGRLNASVKSRTQKIVKSLPKGAGVGLPGPSLLMWAAGAVLLACFLLSYWEPTIRDLWRIWMQSDEFSSGLLVPFLAGYVLWSQRSSLGKVKIQPCMWGVGAFVVAQAVRFFGLWFMYGSAERLSLVLTFIAIGLLLLGWRLIWRIGPVLLYLFFMLPLPNRVQSWITLPLQGWATTSAVFGLEMLGYDVVREGNVINLNGTMVAVAEACNGLRMLTAFFVISGLVALLMNRKWWEKLIILVSSIPIAFMCNTLRLTITAVAFTRLNTQQWEKAFHDFGGLAMMPLALGLIVLELWLLSNLVVRPADEVQTEVVRRRG